MRPGDDAGGGRGGFGGDVLATLFLYELKTLLRDKRTVIVSIVLPVILVPGILLLSRVMEESREERLEETTYEYALTGSRAGWAGALVRRALAVELPGDSAGRPGFEERELPPEAADSVFRAQEIHLLVEGLTAEEYRALRDTAGAGGDTAGHRREMGPGEGEEEPVPDSAAPSLPVVRLHYRSDSEYSRTARRDLRDRLEALRTRTRDSLLAVRGLPVDPARIAEVETRNVATPEEEGGALLGIILTPLIVLMMLSGGSVVAADAISGEKERGTLETLLTTAATRREIVAAKELAIMAVGVAIAVINVANILIYLGVGLIDVPADMAVSVAPDAALALLLLYLPVTALVAGVLLLLSGYAGSYKEFQIYFFPVFILFIFPSLAGVLPGVELRSAVLAVPLANVAVAVKEVLSGTVDWPFVAVAVAVTGGAAAWATALAARTLSVERLITSAGVDRAELRGGPELFPRRVLRWFAVMWALLVVLSLWLGAEAGIRVQVAVNLLGIFLGGSLLIVRRYRLDPREAFALRLPRPPAWLAVLVGAPSAHFAAIGVARVSRHFLPVPERLIESFSQFLVPESLPLWQIVLFLAVLPGICEELAFRGVLLHGLRRRFHPVVLALVVGAIFGFFHVELFRLVPTAYLGVVLAGVVLLTGSIYPAMLWHALNNAVGLVPAYLGWWTEEPPPWTAWWGLAGLALAFWILWRSRTPYPDLEGS